MEQFLMYSMGAVGLFFVAIFGWAFQISSRVAVQERRQEDLKEVHERSQEDLKELIEVKLESIVLRLTRIETALNGYMRLHQ